MRLSITRGTQIVGENLDCNRPVSSSQICESTGSRPCTVHENWVSHEPRGIFQVAPCSDSPPITNSHTAEIQNEGLNKYPSNVPLNGFSKQESSSPGISCKIYIFREANHEGIVGNTWEHLMARVKIPRHAAGIARRKVLRRTSSSEARGIKTKCIISSALKNSTTSMNMTPVITHRNSHNQ